MRRWGRRGRKAARRQKGIIPDNDFLNWLDGGNLDYLDCGAGEDNVYMADPGDTVLANCQRNIGP